MANEQDILVYFHAQWCIHCTTIEPVMTEVANFMTQDPSFVLYKIDGAKNEVVHDGVKIFAYPTIYFFPANRYLVDDFGQVQTLRKPIKYDVEEGDGIGGILSAESLITFIRKHRHHVGSTDSTEAPTEEVESEGSNSATEEEEEEVAVEEIATEEDEHVQLDHIVYENEGTEEDMQQLEEESFAEVNEDGSIFLEEKV